MARAWLMLWVLGDPSIPASSVAVGLHVEGLKQIDVPTLVLQGDAD